MSYSRRPERPSTRTGRATVPPITSVASTPCEGRRRQGVGSTVPPWPLEQLTAVRRAGATSSDVLRSRDRHGARALTSLNEAWFAGPTCRRRRRLTGGSFRSVAARPTRSLRQWRLRPKTSTAPLPRLRPVLGASLLVTRTDVVNALRPRRWARARHSRAEPARSCSAEAIDARVAASNRFDWFSSGTEALIERGATRARSHRSAKIVKFDGCYHGHSDALWWRVERRRSMGLPGSAGVTRVPSATHRRPLQRSADVDHHVAAVLVEPVART